MLLIERLDEYYQVQVNRARKMPQEEGFRANFFFNQTAHLWQQSDTPPYQFYLYYLPRKQIRAFGAVFAEGPRGLSPYRASFGGLEMYASPPVEKLTLFLLAIEDFLRKEGLKTLTWRFYPDSYAPEEAACWSFALQQAGYKPQIVELNQHLPIRAAAFEARLHSTARRKYRRLREAGFACHQIPAPDWADVHAFVARARQRQGYPMSLSSEALEKLGRAFPQDFLVFEVLSSQAERAALGVVIRINAQILYHFYPADEAKFLSFSPAILLNGGIYEYGQERGYAQLDLGISSEKGQLNEGLWRFKQTLGAQNTLKTTFAKSITNNE